MNAGRPHRLWALAGILHACSPTEPNAVPVPMGAPQPAEPSMEPDHPPILLVVLDTVRVDHSSAYGYHRPTTPALSQLAAQGVRFNNVSTAGTWTWPNHASLFTGEPPWVHGATFAPFDESDILATDQSMSLREMRTDLPTLAEQLGDAGYSSLALSANPILRSSLGLTRGFQHVETPAAPGNGHAADRRVIQRLQAYLEGSPEGPQFVFLNLFSAHMPYVLPPSEWTQEVDWIEEEERALLTEGEPPDWLEPFIHHGPPAGMSAYAWLDKENRIRVSDAYATGALELPSQGTELLTDLYDANIRLADHYLGQALNLWLGAYPDSIVIVTSDHGEFLGEHQLLDHGRFAYPEVLQIPLIIRAPALPAGILIESPVQLHELAPLILRLSGVAPSLEGAMASSLNEDLDPRTIAARAWMDPTKATHVGGRFAEGSIALQEGDEWAIVQDSGSVELFNFSQDPSLSHDLSPDQPLRAQELRDLAQTLTQEEEGLSELDSPTVSEDVHGQLEALGYMESPRR